MFSNFQDILKKAQKNINFVRLQFVDVSDRAKNVKIPVKKLPAALGEGVNFDSSSIQVL